MKEKGRSSPESLCALGHIVHQGHNLFRYADARQNRWQHLSGFGGSQPFCRHLPIPDSVQDPGPDWHTVYAGFGASSNQASQRPEPPHNTHHPPNHSRHLRPPRGHPVQPRIILHPRTPVPHPRFRPPHGRCRLDSPKPSVPPTPRHPVKTANPAAASTQPGRTLFVAAVSPDGRTAPPTAGAVVTSTPHSAATDLPPLPEPPTAANTDPSAPRL